MPTTCWTARRTDVWAQADGCNDCVHVPVTFENWRSDTTSREPWPHLRRWGRHADPTPAAAAIAIYRWRRRVCSHTKRVQDRGSRGGGALGTARSYTLASLRTVGVVGLVRCSCKARSHSVTTARGSQSATGEGASGPKRQLNKRAAWYTSLAREYSCSDMFVR